MNERYRLPVLDYVWLGLNRTCFFTKVDLCLVFWPSALGQEPNFLTTCISFERFHWLRLSYRQLVQRVFSVSDGSDETHPSTDRGIQWGTERQNAFYRIKKAISIPPILFHYRPDSPVRVQCSFIHLGLGAVLIKMQGQLITVFAVAFARKIYPQIEKKVLDVVFSFERFHSYTYVG